MGDSLLNKSGGYVSSQRNPWLNDCIGSRRTILQLAEDTGLLQKDRISDEDDAMTEELYKTSPSLKMIALDREIKQAKRSLDEVNFEIHCHLRDKEVQDIIHANVLERRIQTIRELIAHLDGILKQKDLLIARLQQPFINHYLKIDVAYQKHASEVIPCVATMLTSLPASLRDIEWSAQLTANDSRLNDVMSGSAAVLGSQQAIYQHISKLRSAMHRLHSQKKQFDLQSS